MQRLLYNICFYYRVNSRHKLLRVKHPKNFFGIKVRRCDHVIDVQCYLRTMPRQCLHKIPKLSLHPAARRSVAGHTIRSTMGQRKRIRLLSSFPVRLSYLCSYGGILRFSTASISLLIRQNLLALYGIYIFAYTPSISLPIQCHVLIIEAKCSINFYVAIFGINILIQKNSTLLHNAFLKIFLELFF